MKKILMTNSENEFFYMYYSKNIQMILSQLRKNIIFSLYSFIKIIIVVQFLHCSISNRQEGIKKLESRFKTAYKSMQFSKSATVLIHSDKYSLHEKYTEGFLLVDGKKSPSTVDQPFHIASIGKVFTAVIIFQLHSDGKISVEEKVEKYLPKDLLKDLYVIDGLDYSQEVTIKQLLSHTSGVADYFESEDKKSPGIINEIPKQPDKFWSPTEILDYTRKNKTPVAKPGKIFHYSDTGYILLGLLIEKVTGKKYEDILIDKILNPLGMKNTYMYYRSEPLSKDKKKISPMMLGKLEVTDYKSISSDWTGGGIISTTEDLFLFHKALIEGKILRKEFYEYMKGKNKFLDGIYYGYGLMTVNFGDILFIMKGTPKLYGHSGLLSTLMFYSPEYDTHIIANFGSTDDNPKSFEMMYWILSTIKEIKNLK